MQCMCVCRHIDIFTIMHLPVRARRVLDPLELDFLGDCELPAGSAGC